MELCVHSCCVKLTLNLHFYEIMIFLVSMLLQIDTLYLFLTCFHIANEICVLLTEKTWKTSPTV